MLPNALPQLIDTILRLPLLEAAQLQELMQRLPDPQALAEEMVRRGWITPDQASTLFPDPQQPPTPRETMLFGFGDDETSLAADGENFDLIVSEEDDAPSTPPFACAVPAPVVAGGNAARPWESDADRPPRRRMGWASKGLLLGAVFLGGLLAGLHLLGANPAIPPAERPESREASAGDPARAVDGQPAPQIVPIDVRQQFDDVVNALQQNGQAEAPAAVPPAAPAAAPAPVAAAVPARANDAKPKSKASLYARVRQVVAENKTEETDRLGIGDFAYENVPDDGSILVGMAVTYAPFFTHHIIKSVQPIYQRPDGTRSNGPVCGNPTGVGERVIAREGYAIGGAAIKAGMGIDGMQLTFMEIGAEGLNPNKTYLSKWLGGNGGAAAQTYVNDGRPIVGIAGMRSRDANSPAFCLCLVTTREGALADADGRGYETPPSNKAKPSDNLVIRIGQDAPPTNNAKQGDSLVIRIGQDAPWPPPATRPAPAPQAVRQWRPSQQGNPLEQSLRQLVR